ncbi:MAG: hypothetical protein DRK00_02415 [Thermoprotei archaeon]|nr:MAG: hypothetical protein DRK00_02415 [Thermoprotei archaeon]
MISWSRAFLLALKVVVYSILWVIVGTALIVVGTIFAGVPLAPQGIWGAYPPPITGVKALVGLVLVILGLFILAFGTLASIIKVAVDEAARIMYRPHY